MVLFILLTLIKAIGLLSSQISIICYTRGTVIVELLSGVLALQLFCMGQLGSGMGLFNSSLQSQGIAAALFRKLVASGVLPLVNILQTSKGVLRTSNVEGLSIGFSSDEVIN